MTTLAQAAETITINGTEYAVEILDPLPDHSHAIRLSKADGKVYDVTRDFSGYMECDCADATYRHNGLDTSGCKHIRSLRDAGLFDHPPIGPIDGFGPTLPVEMRGGWQTDESEPDDEDRAYWAQQNDGGWVEGQPEPWSTEMLTESAFDHYAALAEER